jgi:N-acetylneuraminic acid mutarotase
MKMIISFVVAVCGAVFLHTQASQAQLGTSWTNKANLLKQGRSFGVAVLNGKIYLAGGYCGSLCELATLDEYDPVGDTWTHKANMQTVRYAPAAAALNGQVYAMGGYTSTSGLPYVVFASVEAYDPSADSWTNKASMSQARFAFQAVTLNGKIYAIGGNVSSDGTSTSAAEMYDPVLDLWSRVADMPTGRVSFAAAALNGNIYVIGGRINNTEIPEVWIYNPTANAWTVGARIPTARETVGAIAFSGQILALGGTVPGGVPVAAVEQYNPGCNVWMPQAQLPASRNECYAAVISNTAYVFGGYNDYSMQAASLLPQAGPVCISLLKAVKPSLSNLQIGTNYQLQVSMDLSNWTNFGAPFMATNASQVYPQYFDVADFGQLFFRLVSP